MPRKRVVPTPDGKWKVVTYRPQEVTVYMNDLIDLFDAYAQEMGGGICSFDPALLEDRMDDTPMLRRLYAAIAPVVRSRCPEE